jgi:Calcineurin-like phosphoesterase
LVVVPDPQRYTINDELARTYRRQMRWIVRSASRLNTRLVISVGDLVQKVDSAAHWARADAAWRVLDVARVPYSVVPGNHDMTSDGVAEHYDQTFPVGRHASHATYGGYLGDPTDDIPDPAHRGNKDSYHLVSWKGVKLLVLALEMDLPVYAVEWAQAVIDAFPRRRVVLVTHRWLWEDGTRWERTFYRTDTDLLTPEETWQQLVRPNCRVFMVVMGHEHTETRRTDRNRCGGRVFQLLADYQERPNGGDGWLRYYTFRPGKDRIDAFTYSVTREETERDADSRFWLRWKH